jgi:hypothetical protein
MRLRSSSSSSSSSSSPARGRPSRAAAAGPLLLLALALALAAAPAATRAAPQPEPQPAARFADAPVPPYVAPSSRPRAAFTSKVDHASVTSASALIPVTLDASGSSPSAQRYEWTVLRWRQEQDVGAAVRRLAGRSVALPLAPNYTYSVDLAVMDGAGEKGFATGPVWVEPQAAAVASPDAAPVGPGPKVVISSPLPLQPTTSADGGGVTLDGSRTRPGTSGSPVVSYAWRAWRLTDGEPVLDLSPQPGAVAKGVQLGPGGTAYTVELTARDAAGNVGVGSAEVYVGRPGKAIPATSTSAT